MLGLGWEGQGFHLELQNWYRYLRLWRRWCPVLAVHYMTQVQFNNTSATVIPVPLKNPHPSLTENNEGPLMPFLDLPNEIILHISEEPSLGLSDLNSLVRTSSRLAALLQNAPTEALFRAQSWEPGKRLLCHTADHGDHFAVKKLLDRGILDFSPSSTPTNTPRRGYNPECKGSSYTPRVRHQCGFGETSPTDAVATGGHVWACGGGRATTSSARS